MKMYDYPAPNAQKVRIFAYEKNISIEYIPVDLIKHALRTPEMLKKNPLGTVPFLELDDGYLLILPGDHAGITDIYSYSSSSPAHRPRTYVVFSRYSMISVRRSLRSSSSTSS